MSFFKKIDEKSGAFYFIIALICFVIFVATMVYSFTKVQFNPEIGTYLVKGGGNVFELQIERKSPYFNEFISDTEDIQVKKENDVSSLIFTDFINYEETDNFKIQANLPKINISSELNIIEFEKIKDKIVDINDRISTIRTVFEGDNQLNFNYYASYYQNTLSFGYSYYENFNNAIVSEKNSLVYDFNRNKTLSFSEYLNSRGFTESKISGAIREVIRREKLKHKYNKRTKFFYVDSGGIINLILNDKSKILIVPK